MLQVIIDSDNVYYALGLQNILMGIMERDNSERVVPSPFTIHTTSIPQPDVIFREFMVSINIIDKECPLNGLTAKPPYRTINVPFTCKENNFVEIVAKVRKIMMIASLGYGTFNCNDIYKAAGLKRYLQLSSTENIIMLLTGKGNDAKEISRLLKRSERTVGTHCRNAIKKMGMENRLEFYKYASYLARFGKKDEITLCL